MADKVFTDANFESDVLKSDKPVMIDFWAVWCGPCQVLNPIVDEIATQIGDKVTIGKMNVDENPVVPQKYGIMSIPTIMIFKNGAVVRQFIGVQSKETLLSELHKLTN